MPVNSSFLFEPILYDNPQALALHRADFRTGDAAVVAPKGRFRVGLRHHADFVPDGVQFDFAHRHG